MKVSPVCQPLTGTVLVVLRTYSTDCPLAGTGTALIVMRLCVLLDSVGAGTVAPSLLATALAVTVPVGVIALVAPVTLDAGILDGSVIVLVLALYVVGVPVIVTVTTVLFDRTAVPAVSPGGRLDTAKLDAVIVLAYVPFVNVYTILAPLTA